MSSAALLRNARHAARLSQADLARRAGTSQPAVARYESGAASPSVRTLERLLHSAGFRLNLETEEIGSMADLRSERMQHLRKVRPAIESAVRSVGGSNVRVFGSVVRGEDGPDSDIDLLIDLPLGESGLGPLIDLAHDLSSLLNERVDMATPEILKPKVARAALAEAVPL